MCQWIKQNERAWELLFCSCICVKKKKTKKKKQQREMKKEVERMDARMVDERRKKKAKPKE